jgi:autotransporter passenger strand-loop-strand repeat protein
VTQLIEDAYAAERGAIDLYQHTRLLNEALDDRSRHQVSSGDTADVSGRITSNATVASSSALIVLSGGADSGAVVSTGGTETVSGGGTGVNGPCRESGIEHRIRDRGADSAWRRARRHLSTAPQAG